MSETKHTRGPWIVKKGAGWLITRPNAEKRREPALAVGMTPATTLVEASSLDDKEAEANALLMAAAPELLEALRGLLDWYLRLANSGDAGFWNPEEEAQVIAARAAIRKAEVREDA